MIGVYKIVSPSGKIYVGSSINIEHRIRYYRTLNCKGQTKLFNSILKYGWDEHIFEILEECTLEELYEKERYYGELFNVLSNNGLNCILPKNDDEKSGVSSETKLKMSFSKKGIKNNFYGKHHTTESKIKMSNYHKGKTLTESHKQKVSLNNKRNNSKLVLNLDTGIFYMSAKEAADSMNIKHSTLKSQLNGTNKRKYNLIYC